MHILQIAKFYPPLRSARALQAVKVTDAIKLAGYGVSIIAGIPNDKAINELGNIVYIRYSDKYLKGLLPSKINKIIKEFCQLTYHNRWVRDSIKISDTLLSTLKSNIVLTQSTPFESHLVGLYLKKKYKVKWLAAFSDPYPVYISPFPYNNSPKVPFVSLRQRTMLNRVLKYADRILVSSKEAYDLMSDYSRSAPESKYCIVPHIGIEIYDGAEAHTSDGWLVYTGKVTKERAIKSLLLAIRSMKAANNKFKGIKFIGHVTPEFKDEVKDLNLMDCVLFFGEVEQASIYNEIRNCSGLVLIEANMEYSPFLPSKFADYATLMKPILALVPESSQVSYYLGKYGGGIVCGYDRVSIEDGIRQLMDGKVTSSIMLSNYFSISNVSRVYAEIFQKVLEG